MTAFLIDEMLPAATAGRGQAAALAKILDRWTHECPDPYLGPHWPRVS